MNKSITLLIASTLLTGIAAYSEVQPEQVSGQKAEYDESTGAVIVSGKLPTTSYDSEYYIYEELDHISEVLFERHTPGTPWPANAAVGVITNPAPGDNFRFVDPNVSPDAKYEYRITCYVDGVKGYSGYAQVYTGVTPGKPDFFSASTAGPDATSVTLTVTAPATSPGGAPLSSLTAIDIELYQDFSYSLLHSIENVTPGETYTWTHDNLSIGKTYYYRARARKGETGWGEADECQAYVGLDIPEAAGNASFTVNGDNEVILSWEAPTKGMRGGSIIPDDVSYVITRRLLDGEEIPVATTEPGQTSYTDRHGYDEETWIEYAITSCNAAGESYKATELPGISVGAPASLPFAESFSYGSFDHKGWTRHSTQDDPYYTYVAWRSMQSSVAYHWDSDDYLHIYPQDEDLGFASCLFYSYSPDGQLEGLISPRIAIGNASEMTLSFYLFDFDAYSSGNLVAVSYCGDNDVYQEVFRSSPEEDTIPGWTEIKFDFPIESDTENIRLRIDAIRGGIPIIDVFVDNILLEAKDQSGVELPAAALAGNGPATYYTMDGRKISNPTSGLYIKKDGTGTEKVIIR